MSRSAAMRRPLRSKRAMISPVRLRANASGFTRIRVRSMRSPRVGSALGARRRRLGGRRLLARGLAPAAPRAGRRGGRAHLGLAERAQLPRRVDGLAARVAAFLQLALAARTAQVVALDLVLAVRAEL